MRNKSLDGHVPGKSETGNLRNSQQTADGGQEFFCLSLMKERKPREKPPAGLGGCWKTRKKKMVPPARTGLELGRQHGVGRASCAHSPGLLLLPTHLTQVKIPSENKRARWNKKKNSTSTRLSSLVRWATVWPFNCLPSASHKRRGPRASSHLKHAVGSPWRSRMDSETNIPKDGDMCIHSFGFVPFRPTQRPASNNRRQYGKRKTIVVTSQRRKKQKRTQDETKRIKKQKWSAQKEWKAEKKEGTAETAIYVRCNTCTILPRAPGLDGKILLPPENKK